MFSFKLSLRALVIAAAFISVTNAQHYYGGDGPIPLYVDSTKVLIKFDPDIPFLDLGEILDAIPRITSVIENEEAIDNFIVCSLQVSTGYYQFLDSLNSVYGILFSEPYYVLNDGTPIMVGQTICIGFNGSVSAIQADSIADAFGITIDTAILSNVYIMKNTPASGYGVLELANILYDLPQTSFSHPDFGLRPTLTAYKAFDFYHSRQPHLKKVIGQFNVASVWDFAGTSDSVIVSVIDDGLIQHEDLPLARILQGADIKDGDKNPYPFVSDAHGMATAGIIAASHTIDSIAGLNQNTGVISMDRFVKILPVRLFQGGEGMGLSDMAKGITWAWKNGAAILSNS